MRPDGTRSDGDAHRLHAEIPSILPHHGGFSDRFQSCRKVAQHFRFIGELQPDQLVGPLFDGDQAIGDEIHVVVGVDPARNGQANQFQRAFQSVLPFRDPFPTSASRFPHCAHRIPGKVHWPAPDPETGEAGCGGENFRRRQTRRVHRAAFGSGFLLPAISVPNTPPDGCGI